MNHSTPHPMNPDLDLAVERFINAPRELVWSAWTRPEHLKKWFTPAPWTTTECEIDLRPGGIFRTLMRGPAGEEHATVGCYLEIVENEKLVWTIALAPGFRPVTVPSDVPALTAIITFTPEGSGTRYKATAIHGDEAGRKKHEAMGFHEGWGTVTEQLAALVEAP